MLGILVVCAGHADAHGVGWRGWEVFAQSVGGRVERRGGLWRARAMADQRVAHEGVQRHGDGRDGVSPDGGAIPVRVEEDAGWGWACRCREAGRRRLARGAEAAVGGCRRGCGCGCGCRWARSVARKALCQGGWGVENGSARWWRSREQSGRGEAGGASASCVR